MRKMLNQLGAYVAINIMYLEAKACVYIGQFMKEDWLRQLGNNISVNQEEIYHIFKGMYSPALNRKEYKHNEACAIKIVKLLSISK